MGGEKLNGFAKLNNLVIYLKWLILMQGHRSFL